MASPKIAPFYRFYFLYCEPISAFLGGIGTFVAPNRILEGTTPASLFPLATATPNPLTKILITNIGALYFLFAWNQFVVLRITKDLSVWRALMLGMILCDVGHLYALFDSDPTAFVSPWAFRGSDWINEGTLWLGLLSRLAFVAGVGVSGKA